MTLNTVKPRSAITRLSPSMVCATDWLLGLVMTPSEACVLSGIRLPFQIRRRCARPREQAAAYCWASEPDQVVRLAGCGCGSATRTGTATRSPGRARTTSRSTRSPQRLADERGHGDRLRDERGVRAVNGLGRGAHPLRHEPFRVRRDRVVVLGDQEPGRLALPARRGGVL